MASAQEVGGIRPHGSLLVMTMCTAESFGRPSTLGDIALLSRFSESNVTMLQLQESPRVCPISFLSYNYTLGYPWIRSTCQNLSLVKLINTQPHSSTYHPFMIYFPSLSLIQQSSCIALQRPTTSANTSINATLTDVAGHSIAPASIPPFPSPAIEIPSTARIHVVLRA